MQNPVGTALTQMPLRNDKLEYFANNQCNVHLCLQCGSTGDSCPRMALLGTVALGWLYWGHMPKAHFQGSEAAMAARLEVLRHVDVRETDR